MDVTDLDFYQPTPKEIQVWRVCDALLSEKKRITYQSIGEHLLEQGLKRGSNSDICRYLASWKKHHYPKAKLATSEEKLHKSISKGNNKLKQSDLGFIFESLKNIENSQNEILKRTKNVQTSSAHKSSSISSESLLRIIKEQKTREQHYLAALSHSREIQNLLKKQIQQYQAELKKYNSQ